MMRPEGVPAELVEKAALAVAEFTYCGHCDGSCKACTGEARAAIAAVLPDIQAQAFEAAAVRVRANFAAHGEQCPWVGFLDDEAARLRAARLTDTSEGEEK